MNNGKRVLLGILIAILTLSVSTAAYAEGPVTKLQRGAINTTTGWLELFVQPAKGAQGEEPFQGTLLGIGQGFLCGLQRTGVGLADALSFPVGPYDRPVMEPETLFSES